MALFWIYTDFDLVWKRASIHCLFSSRQCLSHPLSGQHSNTKWSVYADKRKRRRRRKKRVENLRRDTHSKQKVPHWTPKNASKWVQSSNKRIKILRNTFGSSIKYLFFRVFCIVGSYDECSIKGVNIQILCDLRRNRNALFALIFSQGNKSTFRGIRTATIDQKWRRMNENTWLIFYLPTLCLTVNSWYLLFNHQSNDNLT